MNIIDRVKLEEGFYPVEYRDSLGFPTIGYGTRLPLSKCEIEVIGGFDGYLTSDEADILLRSRLARFKKEFYNHVPWAEKEPIEVKNILENMLYQLGVGGLLGFDKTLKFIQRGDYKKASEEMLDSLWAKKQTTTRARQLSLEMKKIAKKSIV